MNRINSGRVLLGGIVAGILLFVGDGVVHGVLLKEWWEHAMAALGRGPGEGSQGFPYFAAYDLLKGMAIVWIYAAIRPRFGAGPRTAVVAALVGWFLVIPVALLGQVPMHFFGRRLAALLSIYGAVPMVIAGLVGAWIYREQTPSPSAGSQASRIAA